MSVYVNPTGQANIGYGVHRSRWQDWINLILGIWLFITPWIWGPGMARYNAGTTPSTYSTSSAPAYRAAPNGVAGTTYGTTGVTTNTTTNAYTQANPIATTRPGIADEWNAWIVGAIIFLASLCALFAFSAGAEWINLFAGIWLFLSPWALGFAVNSGPATWNAWILGIIVFVVALLATQSARSNRFPEANPPANA